MAAQEVTVVEVRNPVNHQGTGSNKTYTDFEICIKTTNKAFIIPQSYVRRRYSDFVWLRTWLRENNEGFLNNKIPMLPPKKLVHRFDAEFLKGRMAGLQTFLKKIIEHNVFLSDKALHLFLQSGMSVKQIDNYLQGKDDLEHSQPLFHGKIDEETSKNSSILGSIIEKSDSAIGCNSSSSLTESFEKVDVNECQCFEDELERQNTEKESTKWNKPVTGNHDISCDQHGSSGNKSIISEDPA